MDWFNWDETWKLKVFLQPQQERDCQYTLGRAHKQSFKIDVRVQFSGGCVVIERLIILASEYGKNL